MALDELKVKAIPAAFAAQAQLHNALVDLIAKMRGTSGIVVQATEGGIVISLNPTALQGLNTGSGGGNVNVGGTVQCVGPNGVLVDVVQPVAPNTPNTYPNYLRVDDPGFPLGNTTYIEPGDATSWNITNGTLASLRSTGLYMTDGSTNLDVPISGLTHSMGIKEIDVCVNGNAAKMLVIASDPY